MQIFNVHSKTLFLVYGVSLLSISNTSGGDLFAKWVFLPFPVPVLPLFLLFPSGAHP